MNLTKKELETYYFMMGYKKDCFSCESYTLNRHRDQPCFSCSMAGDFYYWELDKDFFLEMIDQNT